MDRTVYERIFALSAASEELNDTVQYMARHLAQVIHPGDTVLVCHPRKKPTDFGTLAEQAVLRCGGIPVFWENDLRWKELLRLAFVSRASAIIAPPLITLGLAKLAIFEGVPLYFYHAVLVGYPCLNWMMDGIEKALDCKTSGFMGPGGESVLSGSSCNCGRGIHIRRERYGFAVLDDKGIHLPAGQRGRLAIYHRDAPSDRLELRSFGRILDQPCCCGDPSDKIVDLDLGEWGCSPVSVIVQELLMWNSILECRVNRTEFGLEAEIITLPGEKIPKLPNFARLDMRPWDPDRDIPFSYDEVWAIS